MKKLSILLCLTCLYLSGCSTADTTGNSTQREYEIVFKNSGSGSINVFAPATITASTKSAADQTTDNDPATDVAPSTSMGLNGGTSSLATEGGKLALEGVNSMLKAMSDNEGLPQSKEVEVKKPQTDTSTFDEVSGETGLYWGRHNGDRATWYFSKDMNEYPETFTLTVHGCAEKLAITNNGTRFEDGGYIVKQSDVAGRGMAVVTPSSCKSEEASIMF